MTVDGTNCNTNSYYDRRRKRKLREAACLAVDNRKNKSQSDAKEQPKQNFYYFGNLHTIFQNS